MKGLRSGVQAFRRSGFRVAGALLLVGAAVGPLVACWGPEYESVHFNSARPDFFRMPQPWPGVPSEKRAQLVETHDEHAWDRPSQADALAQAARAAESSGDFRRALDIWRKRDPALRRETSPGYYGATPKPVEGLDDRMAALALWRGPSDSASLRAYLSVRDKLPKELGATPPQLAQVTSDVFQPRVAYLRAALLFNNGDTEGALKAFQAAGSRFSKDPLIRYMVGRCAFRLILQGEEKSINAYAPTWKARRLELATQAVAAYELAMKLAPDSDLARGADGMVAACNYRLERYPEALLHYCRQLAALRGSSGAIAVQNAPVEGDEGHYRAEAHATAASSATSAFQPDPEESRWVWISARDTLRRMSPADHQRFQQMALAEPNVATAYLDLHLRYGRLGANSQQKLGLFALELLKRKPGAAVSGRLLTRLADIQERFGDHAQSERLSAAALKRLPSGVYQDEARWQHGLALRSLKRNDEALKEFEQLSRTGQPANIRAGAHEAAALLAESGRDYANAIRHYFELNYGLDYGYLVDIIAAPSDLESFLKRFPEHPRAKLIRYSLAFRHMRAGQYDQAVKTFESLGPAYLEAALKKYDSKTSHDESTWAPLRTARFLADSTRREAAAKTPAEKAKIAYERGALLFHQRYELLYNGALWEGRRVYALQIAGPPGPSDIPSADHLLEQHEKEHTSLYQAILVFEHVAKDYPRTPEAPKALYSAAMCCTFMSNMDSYWRSHAAELEGRAIRYYRRVQREYPQDPLAASAAKFGGKA